AAAEERELLAALEADAALRDRLVADKEFDGLLGAVCADDADAFARSFQDRLAVEDDSRFVARVEKRIRRAPPRSSSGWFLAAAGVLAAVILIVMLSGTRSPAPVVK